MRFKFKLVYWKLHVWYRNITEVIDYFIRLTERKSQEKSHTTQDKKSQI